MNIIYSFNKTGFEADYWQREIAGATGEGTTFIPFNHEPYLAVSRYLRAQHLDNLWYDRDPGLMRMYEDVQALIEKHNADALIVDNCFPYHPEFLRKLPIYKVLRTTDGPLAAYDRDFAYVHAYDHVLYHSPAYSRDLGMEEKLRYVGARRADFLPLALFDRMFDPEKDEQSLISQARDVDIVFVGALFPNKMPLLARVKKAFGKRVRLHGLTSWKRNAYFNVKYGFPGWVRPIAFEEYVPLYQRSRIGINVHNRGMYTVGSFRLLELPANGVMQISDGGPYLSKWFDVGKEVVGYDEADDLVAKISYYLDHEDERLQIAAAGHRAVMQRHRLRRRMHETAELIREGMSAKKREA
jgi:spore maturation protein CgeB